MENKKNSIPEEQLEQVAGGVSTAGMKYTSEWNAVCENYECKLCGTHSRLLTGHKDGCAVAAFDRPETGEITGEFSSVIQLIVQNQQGSNGCWSCKYMVRGKDSKLYCGRGKI